MHSLKASLSLSSTRRAEDRLKKEPLRRTSLQPSSNAAVHRLLGGVEFVLSGVFGGGECFGAGVGVGECVCGLVVVGFGEGDDGGGDGGEFLGDVVVAA